MMMTNISIPPQTKASYTMNAFAMVSIASITRYWAIPLDEQLSKIDPINGGKQGKTAFMREKIKVYENISIMDT